MSKRFTSVASKKPAAEKRRSGRLRSTTTNGTTNGPSKRASKTAAYDSGSDTDFHEETEWEVEKVIDKRRGEDGQVSYLLKWKSWTGEPTWEPEDNCMCSRLIEIFEQNNSAAKSSAKKGNTQRSSTSPSTPPVKFKSTPKRRSRI